MDISLEVCLLSQYQVNPREGHLEQLFHIFAFLRKHPKVKLYILPELPRIDYGEFQMMRSDFAEFYYRDAEEQCHIKCQNPVAEVTRRSHTGYVVFLNRAPIVWYRKRQQTVETSALSAEFIALKVCLEAIENLRFKLRCFGVPIPQGEQRMFSVITRVW